MSVIRRGRERGRTQGFPLFARRLQAAAFWLLSFLMPLSALAETITVGGVGSLSPLLKQLGEAYAQRNPGIEIHVIPPVGSTGGLRALAAGKVDIALVGRPLKPEEAGQATLWVQTPLVLATFGGKSKGLSLPQIADIYAGRKTSWDDGKPIRPVLRGAHESETQALRSMAAEIDTAVGEALKRPGLPIAENDIDAIEMLGKIVGSLGTTSLGLIKSENARLQPLPINGQVPDLPSLENGRYPWRRIYHLVTKLLPSPATAAFMAYLKSPAAMASARKLDYLPAK